MNNEEKRFGAIWMLLFIVYNFLVFFIEGIFGHHITFWVSYVFEVISFAVITIFIHTLMRDSISKKRLILGYPIIFWTILYGIVQCIVNIVAMHLDKYLVLAVVLQILFLTLYIILMLLCFHTSEVIENIQTTRAAQSANMKIMTEKIEGIASENINKELDISLKKLSEEFQFSDIVSSGETLLLEQQLMDLINELELKCSEDPAQALILMTKISNLLKKRNIVCKNSKYRY